MVATPKRNARTNTGKSYHLPRQPQLIKTKKMRKEEIKEMADFIAAKLIKGAKEVLTSDEVADYMGISKSYLYKLTMRKEIPHYKPMGKVCYFNRKEVEQWLQANRVATSTEIEQRAQDYCMRKGGAR